MQKIGQLKIVLRGLRYQPLPHLINRKLKVNSLATLESDVKLAFGNDIPTDIKIAFPESYQGHIAKYNMLDLRIQVPRESLEECPIITSKTFRELGFITSKETKQEMMDGDEQWEFSVIQGLAEDITENKALLRIILIAEYNENEQQNTPKSKQLRQTWKDKLAQFFGENVKKPQARVTDLRIREMIFHKLGKSYFPRHFIVADACLTNAESIWFNKYFYM